MINPHDLNSSSCVEKAGLAASLAQLNLTTGSETSYPGAMSPIPADDVLGRRKAWEEGHIDYLGNDAFENIQKKLDESINTLT